MKLVSFKAKHQEVIHGKTAPSKKFIVCNVYLDAVRLNTE